MLPMFACGTMGWMGSSTGGSSASMMMGVDLTKPDVLAPFVEPTNKNQ